MRHREQTSARRAHRRDAARPRSNKATGEPPCTLTPKAKYRWRNRIERLFNKLKNWRRIATRYDKAADSYIGFVSLASALLWLPFVHVA